MKRSVYHFYVSGGNAAFAKADWERLAGTLSGLCEGFGVSGTSYRTSTPPPAEGQSASLSVMRSDGKSLSDVEKVAMHWFFRGAVAALNIRVAGS